MVAIRIGCLGSAPGMEALHPETLVGTRAPSIAPLSLTSNPVNLHNIIPKIALSKKNPKEISRVLFLTLLVSRYSMYSTVHIANGNFALV